MPHSTNLASAASSLRPRGRAQNIIALRDYAGEMAARRRSFEGQPSRNSIAGEQRGSIGLGRLLHRGKDTCMLLYLGKEVFADAAGEVPPR